MFFKISFKPIVDETIASAVEKKVPEVEESWLNR